MVVITTSHFNLGHGTTKMDYFTAMEVNPHGSGIDVDSHFGGTMGVLKSGISTERSTTRMDTLSFGTRDTHTKENIG